MTGHGLERLPVLAAGEERRAGWSLAAAACTVHYVWFYTRRGSISRRQYRRVGVSLTVCGVSTKHWPRESCRQTAGALVGARGRSHDDGSSQGDIAKAPAERQTSARRHATM
jgi:hypothetical protein